MASNFISVATQCAGTCVNRSEYTAPCLELDGKIASMTFVKCGYTLECPTDIDELAALVDGGNAYVIHTVDGEMGEPTENIVESSINCIGDKVTYYDHPYTVTTPYSLVNEEWFEEICNRKFSQLFITTKEAVGHEVTNIKQFLAKEYTDSDLHRVVFSFTSRRDCGIKTGSFAAKYPMFDPNCID